MTGLTKITKPIKISEIKRDWRLLDAKGKILGRLASEAAGVLIGKHKVNYVDYLDCGDNVIIINVADVKVTGNKQKNKLYSRYSGYPGGLKKITFEQMIKDNPKKVIESAVSGMLPKNKLHSRRMARLHIFVDAEHPYKDKLSSESK